MAEETTAKPSGFMQGFGSGAIIIAIVALGYIFGFKEDPKKAITDSVQQTYAVVTVGEQAVGELQVTMPDMKPEQVKKLEETKEALAKVRKEVTNIAGLLNIPLVPTQPEVETSEVAPAVDGANQPAAP